MGFQVVGLATDPTDVRLVQERSPDVVAAEVTVEGDDYDGLDGFALFREHAGESRVVVLSIIIGRAHRRDHRAVVVAYVMKSRPPDDLASAVRQAFDHSIYFAETTCGQSRERGTPARPTVPADVKG